MKIEQSPHGAQKSPSPPSPPRRRFPCWLWPVWLRVAVATNPQFNSIYLRLPLFIGRESLRYLPPWLRLLGDALHVASRSPHERSPCVAGLWLRHRPICLTDDGCFASATKAHGYSRKTYDEPIRRRAGGLFGGEKRSGKRGGIWRQIAHLSPPACLRLPSIRL